MRLIQLTIIFLFVIGCKKSNSSIPKEDLSVNAEIIGRSSCCPDNFDNLIVRIDVSNNSNQLKSFWIMKCSWEKTFRTNRADIILNHRECISNFPVEIKLEPTRSITFYTTLVGKSEFGTIEKDTFKIGLMMLDESDFFTKMFDPDYLQTKTTYWSNLLNINYINGYKINDLK